MAEKPKELERSPWMGVPFSAYEDENVLDMLETDLSTYKRPFFPVSPWISPSLSHNVPASNAQSCGRLCEHIPDVADAVSFARASTVNKLVPPKERQNEKQKEEQEQAWKFGEFSQKYEDFGKRRGIQRGVREYLASGYTRRNPNGKTDHDTDWRGKWKERNFQVAEYTWWKLDKKPMEINSATQKQTGLQASTKYTQEKATRKQAFLSRRAVLMPKPQQRQAMRQLKVK